MKLSLLTILIFSIFLGFAGKEKPQYAVNKIDTKIRSTENSIVRVHETIVELTETNAIINEKKVVTLLNDNDFEHYEDWFVFYGNKENVSEVSLGIYDQYGAEIAKVKPKDVQDIAAYDSNLYTDTRLKYISINEYSYPFTIEFSYKKKVRDTYLFLPRWELSETPFSYVEHSSLLIDKPATIDFSIDYRLHGFELEINEVTPTKIHFSALQVPTIDWEDFGPQKQYQKPHIILSPHHFDIEGYKGSFENWQSLGDFYYQINKDRYEVEDSFVEPIKNKVNQANSKEEKVKVVYDYLKEKTRYVSVQLGIGGWQSYPAEYVEKNSYGDCKALTTYTKSLLSYFDIESHPVLIQSVDDDVNNAYELNDDIAYSAFNHVILAVPEGKDTIWLECTSQSSPANFLGSSTMNNKGLVVKPNGESHLASTPKTTPDKDVSTVDMEIWLKDDGSAEIDYNYNAKGILAERLYGAYHYLSKEDFEKYLSDIIDLPNSKLIDYTFQIINIGGLGVELKAKFFTKNVASKTGSRLFLKPLQFQKEKDLPHDVENRKHNFILPNSYSENMNIIYHFPTDYHFETVETDTVDLKSQTGTYVVNYNLADDLLKINSTYTSKNGSFTPETAKEYHEFVSAINATSKRMTVLKQTEHRKN